MVIAECVMQERMHRKLQKKKDKEAPDIYFIHHRGGMVDLFFNNANNIRCFRDRFVAYKRNQLSLLLLQI